MVSKAFLALAVFLVLAVVLFSDTADASAYRKPPFNGSIFGKRGNGAAAMAADMDSRSAAYSALCEIAIEACSSWSPVAQDSK